MSEPSYSESEPSPVVPVAPDAAAVAPSAVVAYEIAGHSTHHRPRINDDNLIKELVKIISEDGGCEKRAPEDVVASYHPTWSK